MPARIALRPRMTPESLQMLFALLIGFAVAGMCSSGYRVFTSRLPSFSQLSTGPGVAALASVPRLVVSAPFLIMRNTILDRRLLEPDVGPRTGDDIAGLRFPARLATFQVSPVQACHGCPAPMAYSWRVLLARADIGHGDGQQCRFTGSRVSRPNFRPRGSSTLPKPRC